MIDYAGGSLLLTAIFTSLVVWIVGLAVPVTASYIICAVIAAPALIKLGVPDFAAHMFIFYYAVLSEVSPPTALSPFAAAAITGGDPYKTTLQCWKYTIPAFLVPFMFVLDTSGQGLLLMGSTKALANADWVSIAQVTATCAVGIASLANDAIPTAHVAVTCAIETQSAFANALVDPINNKPCPLVSSTNMNGTKKAGMVYFQHCKVVL